MYLSEQNQFLKNFLTPERLEVLERGLLPRTRYLTIALEDIYQSQNASAVLRTCDCLGIQDVHVIENENPYNINTDVVRGANKWLTLRKHGSRGHDNTSEAIAHLRGQGYRIVATSPHARGVALQDFDLAKGKAAFFFGTEMHGLSRNMLDQADEFVHIEMLGFTESFNLSVSAAIVLHHLSLKLRQSDLPWRLAEDEAHELMNVWLRRTIKRSNLLVEEFDRRHGVRTPSLAEEPWPEVP